ncbi:MAG: ATP-binding protein [Microscillaceae bacterium]|nr:ATP-binding protein [Microscillaceae bacterium]
MAQVEFKVSARAARLIGRENVANAEGAIIELIKNTYDADASTAILVFNIKSDCMYIIDDGEGMTEQIIKDHWMVVGTDHKQYDFKTDKGRIKTGAKGIGRFALDRLGQECLMLTKTEKEVGIMWKVNWEKFEEKNKTINEVTAELNIIEDLTLKEEIIKILTPFELPSNILDNWNYNRGTFIKISGLRDIWEDKEINQLYTNLELLIPPKEEKTFDIFLFNTLHPKNYGKVQATICDDYDYKLFARITEDKKVTIVINRNELKIEDLEKLDFFSSKISKNNQFNPETFKNSFLEIETTVNQLLPGFKDIDENNNLEKIGSFDFTFYFMKRGGDTKNIEAYPFKFFNPRDRKNWLDKFGGIKIFRDDFRVRPYGEIKGNAFDWLDLGSRSASSPTVTRRGYKVRPQQVYGVINISRIDNINFEDKSSREGLQENSVFLTFKELIIAIIEVFEKDRNQIMMSLKEIYDKKNPKRSILNQADEIIESVKQHNPTNGQITNYQQKDGNTLISAIEIYKEELDELEEEQKILRILAATGLIITSFTHEFKSLSRLIGSRNVELKTLIQDLIKSEQVEHLPDYRNPFVLLEDIKKQDERLKYWLDFSIEAVRKDKRTRKLINLIDYFNSFKNTWKGILSERCTKIVIDNNHLEDIHFKAFEIDLDAIFNNLVANSIDAFSRRDAPNSREIKISLSLEENIDIIYEDSGPGLSTDIPHPEIIFDLFFTTKRDKHGQKVGTGLGMWIVKSTLEEYNGSIGFLNIRPGFKIKITLPYNN